MAWARHLTPIPSYDPPSSLTKEVAAVGKVNGMPLGTQAFNARLRHQLSTVVPTAEGAPAAPADREFAAYPLVELSGSGAATATSGMQTSFTIQLKVCQ